MAVVIETTLGDLTVDLFVEQRPRTCLNFLKLCKLKYYNFNLFHTIQHGFIAQTGDPSGEGTGGCSIWGVIDGPSKAYFEGEKMPKLKHTEPGLLSMVASENGMVGSQFFFTLSPDLNSLDSRHCIIGQVSEGLDIIRQLNETICDSDNKPYQDVRITHTVILEDPFDDPKGFHPPSRSPSPSAERLAGGRIAPDEEIDEFKGKTEEEVAEMIQEREAKARATILEIVGDLPDAEMAPPENVLFVCKLNPVTNDDDLEIIFSRFGKINCCEVIRDKKSGDSLQYAFIEFENKKSCEDAYFKMDNVLIDDRRIHVDFSQSVSKIKWRGKGRGVIHINDSQSEADSKPNEKKNNEFYNAQNNKMEHHSNNRNRNDKTKHDEEHSFKRQNESAREHRRSRERYGDSRDSRNYKNEDSRRYNKDRLPEKSRHRDQLDSRSKYGDFRDNRGNEKNVPRDRSFNQSPESHRNRDHVKKSPERSRNRERFERSPERKSYKSDYRSPDRSRRASDYTASKSERHNERSRDILNNDMSDKRSDKSYERKKYNNSLEKNKYDKSLSSTKDSNGKSTSYDSEYKFGKKYRDDNVKGYNREEVRILSVNQDSVKRKNTALDKSNKIGQDVQNGDKNTHVKEQHNRSKENRSKLTRENDERVIDSNSSKRDVKNRKRKQSSESVSDDSSANDDGIPTKRKKKNDHKKSHDSKHLSKKKHNSSESESDSAAEDKSKKNRNKKKLNSIPKSKSVKKKKRCSSSSSSSSSNSESSNESSDSSNASNKKRTHKRKVVKKNKKPPKKSKKVDSSSSSSESSSSNSDSSSSSTNSSDSGHEQSRKKSKNKKSVREKLIKKKSKK